MKIRAILFDLGDILFEAHFWRKWLFSEFAANFNYQGSLTDFYLLYEDYLRPVYENKTDYYTVFKRFCQEQGVTDFEKFYIRAFQKKRFYEDTRVLYPGVIDLLEFLKESNIKRIIVSDNELSKNELQQQVLKKYGLNNKFEYLFTSYDLRVTKATSVYFTKVLESLKLKNDEVLFVGHDADEINSANQVFIDTVEFNNYLGIPINSTYKINRLIEIKQLIRDIDNNPR